MQLGSETTWLLRFGGLPSPDFGTCAAARRFPSGNVVFHVQEELMKKKIGVFALGAALVFGMATGAWAQSGGASGAGGGAAGAGVGGNSMGGSVGGRVTPNAPNLNPSSPNSVPQSNETPVSPGTQGTSPGSGTR